MVTRFFQAMSLSYKNSPWNLQGLWSVPASDTHPTLVITLMQQLGYGGKLKQQSVK
jgi:hypothetical protein